MHLMTDLLDGFCNLLIFNFRRRKMKEIIFSFSFLLKNVKSDKFWNWKCTNENSPFKGFEKRVHKLLSFQFFKKKIFTKPIWDALSKLEFTTLKICPNVIHAFTKQVMHFSSFWEDINSIHIISPTKEKGNNCDKTMPPPCGLFGLGNRVNMSF